jgi:hypothetical protein
MSTVRLWLNDYGWPRIAITEPAVIYNELVTEIGDPYREPTITPRKSINRMSKRELIAFILKNDPGSDANTSNSVKDLRKEANGYIQ